jgi:hypothetical protein
VEKDVLITAKEMAPQVPRCCLEGHINFSIVEKALTFECRLVQFCKTLLTKNNKARTASTAICSSKMIPRKPGLAWM